MVERCGAQISVGDGSNEGRARVGNEAFRICWQLLLLLSGRGLTGGDGCAELGSGEKEEGTGDEDLAEKIDPRK
jgi:hypothetical protein